MDLELVRRCQADDETAFGQLVERYQRKVFTIALSMVKNPEDAMDIAQDAFIKVHRYIGNFQGSSSFYTWLYRIVVNLCSDHLRRTGKRINMDFDERIGSQSHAEHGNAVVANRLDTNPSKNLGRKELADRIRQAVDALPPYHRAVIVMREIEGMSYAEMAKTMNVSKGTIMSRLHHARHKLQRALGEYLEGDMVVK
ncbi:MAG: sigma-70 family RNA polymerase sigma factor [Deltaproteobacteria bacterium]|nr:sigma-70 family RNA polymerase sigma factor [Deltaproteobacteria bacterium]